MAMMLSVTSSMMQGSVLVKGLTAEALQAAATKAAGQFEKQFAKLGIESADEFATAFLSKVSGKGTGELTSFLDDAAVELEMKSVVAGMKKTATALENIGIDASKVGTTGLMNVDVKFIDNMAVDVTKNGMKFDDAIKKFTEAGMDPAQAKKLVSEMVASKAAVADGILAKTGKAISKSMGKSESAFSFTQKAARKNLLDTLDSSTATVSQRAAATRALHKMEWQAAGPIGKSMRLLGSAGQHAMGPLMVAGGTITAAILFMIPTLFESAFLAQQAHNALLQTYLPPTQFGNIVMQLPDSVINMTNPVQSQFIYYGIPVAAPGQKLSAAAKAMYPGVTGPTAKNPISAEVDNSFAQAFSVGATKKLAIPRYNLDAAALSTLPIFASYTSQSWSSWAANGIADAAFPQAMINLNTGYIFYADGTSQGIAPAGLVGAAGSGQTVQSFLATKQGQLKNANAQAVYTHYVDSYGTSTAHAVAAPLINQFNCSCLESNSGVLSADTVQKCSGSKSSTCLLTKALHQIAAGLFINAQGTALTASQDMATELANGALGQVIPIQGLDKNFDAVLQLFPGAQQQALANSGALTINISANLSSTGSAVIQGAPADNYAAKGVYVYQCQNTPLAKMLRSQSGGAAVQNQITDYIVFLDQNLNQVPLMAPVQDPTNFNFITMSLNPAITYFSTIIGNVDASGNFSFLPQLNIQSPAALVAKGLPASFAPLYGLQAVNGSLAVNYNQNLASTIGSIVQSLNSNPKLGQQFKTMQAAMVGLLGSGPFGKYQLSPVPAAVQPTVAGVKLAMYTGFNGYPVSQDAAHASCSDILIPLSAAGKTVTLPSNVVTQYYGLVTDLTYSVLADGTITVGSKGFVNSPLSAGLVLDTTKTSSFYWMNKLTAMGKASDPNFTMPAQLVSLVNNARTAWVAWINQNIVNNAKKQEFAGIAVPGSAITCTIASQQALANGLYVYTVAPCPSNVTQDYFVLTNSSSPQVSDATLGTMSASSATASSNMISLISGQVYNCGSGALVQNSSGVNYTINAEQLLQALQAKSPKAFAPDFAAKLNIISGQAAIASQALLYPFSFGGLPLGIYQADVTAGVYLYVDASGAGTSTNFAPQDYFVTIDSLTNPKKVATKLLGSTQYVVSLVSGNVYAPAGLQSVIDPQIKNKLISQLSPTWRPGFAQEITALSTSFAALMQSQQQQSQQMLAANPARNGAVTFSQASAAQVIASLAQQNYLPIPYNALKRDPVSGVYVLVTPANADGTQFIYTFFDVANSFVDAQGRPVHVGACYDGQGNLLRVIRGIELVSMLRQYGVSIDKAGHQYLGANNMLPMMQLDPADTKLKPGVSGKSMIYSNDPSFPVSGIVSPLMYQNSKFYIYYNTITQAYYAMQVTGTTARYIDMAGGNVYNLDGSSQAQANPVAFNSNGDMTDLLLPYLNVDGYTRCVMKNSNNRNLYTDFINIEDNFKADTTDQLSGNVCGLNTLVSMDEAASQVQVAQMPLNQSGVAVPDISVAKTYNVYVNQNPGVSYVVTSGYTWQNLQVLPIDMTTRALLNPAPAVLYNSAQVIYKNGVLYAGVFAGKLYGNVKVLGNNTYTLTCGTDSITATVQLDVQTNVQYIAITQGAVTYNYQYVFAALSQAQLQDYRMNVWQGDIVVDVNGNIVLEKYVSADSSGNLQLQPAAIASVINLPTTSAGQAKVKNSLSLILQDTMNKRFFVSVNNGTYAYFAQDGYVDLANGLLFDATGELVGYALAPSDFIALLQNLSMSVVRNATTDQVGLRYNPVAQSAAAPVVVQSYDEGDIKEDAEQVIGTLSSKKKKSMTIKAKSKNKRTK